MCMYLAYISIQFLSFRFGFGLFKKGISFFLFCHSQQERISFYGAINFTFISLQNIYYLKCELT